MVLTTRAKTAATTRATTKTTTTASTTTTTTLNEQGNWKIKRLDYVEFSFNGKLNCSG